jgi:hypothetical protein
LAGALLVSKTLMMARPVLGWAAAVSRFWLLPTCNSNKLGCLGTTARVRVKWMPDDIPRTMVFWLLMVRVAGL